MAHTSRTLIRLSQYLLLAKMLKEIKSSVTLPTGTETLRICNPGLLSTPRLIKPDKRNFQDQARNQSWTRLSNLYADFLRIVVLNSVTSLSDTCWAAMGFNLFLNPERRYENHLCRSSL